MKPSPLKKWLETQREGLISQIDQVENMLEYVDQLEEANRDENGDCAHVVRAEMMCGCVKCLSCGEFISFCNQASELHKNEVLN